MHWGEGRRREWWVLRALIYPSMPMSVLVVAKGIAARGLRTPSDWGTPLPESGMYEWEQKGPAKQPAAQEADALALFPQCAEMGVGGL